MSLEKGTNYEGASNEWIVVKSPNDEETHYILSESSFVPEEEFNKPKGKYLCIATPGCHTVCKQVTEEEYKLKAPKFKNFSEDKKIYGPTS